jgi:hypothetical protein
MKSVLTELSYQATNRHVPNLRNRAGKSERKQILQVGKCKYGKVQRESAVFSQQRQENQRQKARALPKLLRAWGRQKYNIVPSTIRTIVNRTSKTAYLIFFRSRTNPIRSNRTKNAHDHWICIHSRKRCPKMPR